MAKIVMELTGDEKKLVAAFRKATDAQKKQETAAKKMGQTSDTVSQRMIAASRKTGNAGVESSRRQKEALRRLQEKQTQTFGAGAIKKLGNYAAGLFGITQAIAGITSAFRDMEEAKNSAMESVVEAQMGLGKLAQLADTPKELTFLISEAKRIRKEGAVESVGAGGGLVFAVKSGGDIKSLDLYAALRGVGLMEDPEAVAEGNVSMQTNFGVKETGSSRALISKALGASAHSTTGAEELIVATAKSGVSAGLGLGLRDEEAFASMAIAANAKGAEQGGTHLNQMFQTLSSKGIFKGLELSEIVTQVDAIEAEMSEAEKKKWWGRQQGQEMFAVQSRAHREGLYQTILSDVDRAQAEDAVGRKLGLARNNPDLAAARILQASKGALEVARYEELGGARAVSQAAINSREAAVLIERGGASAWGSKKADEVERVLYGVPGMGGDEAFNERDRNWIATVYSLQARLMGLGPVIDAIGGDEVLGSRGQSSAPNSPTSPDQREVVYEIQVQTRALQDELRAQGGRRRDTTLGRPELDR